MGSVNASTHTVGEGLRQPAAGPVLERLSHLKALLQGIRVSMDEDLQPLGITTSQLKMLWSIAQNPGISGAQMARLCSVTPQSGQATLASMVDRGWVSRQPSASSDRVLIAELTGKGQRVLVKARKIAEELDQRLWSGIGKQDLAGFDATLSIAIQRLTRASKTAAS